MIVGELHTLQLEANLNWHFVFHLNNLECENKDRYKQQLNILGLTY